MTIEGTAVSVRIASDVLAAAAVAAPPAVAGVSGSCVVEIDLTGVAEPVADVAHAFLDSARSQSMSRSAAVLVVSRGGATWVVPAAGHLNRDGLARRLTGPPDPPRP